MTIKKKRRRDDSDEESKTEQAEGRTKSHFKILTVTSTIMTMDWKKMRDPNRMKNQRRATSIPIDILRIKLMKHAQNTKTGRVAAVISDLGKQHQATITLH